MRLDGAGGKAGETGDFVLRVLSTGSGEESVLLEQGREVRRTVRVTDPRDGTVVETVHENGAVSATRSYDSRMRLVEETTAAERRVYRYRGELLDSLEVSGPDGKPLYSERYAYTSRGRLREADRSYPDGSRMLSSFLFAGGRLLAERLQAAPGVLTAHYDTSGRLVAESERSGDDLVWKRKHSLRSRVRPADRDGRRAQGLHPAPDLRPGRTGGGGDQKRRRPVPQRLHLRRRRAPDPAAPRGFPRLRGMADRVRRGGESGPRELPRCAAVCSGCACTPASASGMTTCTATARLPCGSSIAAIRRPARNRCHEPGLCVEGGVALLPLAQARRLAAVLGGRNRGGDHDAHHRARGHERVPVELYRADPRGAQLPPAGARARDGRGRAAARPARRRRRDPLCRRAGDRRRQPALRPAADGPRPGRRRLCARLCPRPRPSRGRPRRGGIGGPRVAACRQARGPPGRHRVVLRLCRGGPCRCVAARAGAQGAGPLQDRLLRPRPQLGLRAPVDRSI